MVVNSLQIRPQTDLNGRTEPCQITAVDGALLWVNRFSEFSQLEEFSENLNKFYMPPNELHQIDVSALKHGEVYIFRWACDGGYYRAIFNGDRVRFIDFGNSSPIESESVKQTDEGAGTVNGTQIYEVDSKFSNAPYAYCCKPIYSTSSDIIQRFVENADEIEISFLEKEPTGWKVNVLEWTKEAEKDAKNQRRPVKKGIRKGCIQVVDIKRKLIFVSFEDEDCYRQQVEDLIHDDKKFLIEECKMVAGAEVLAEYLDDQQCYRARILTVHSTKNQCVVEFYDFGNTATCPYSKIYAYDEERFKSIQALAYRMAINGFKAEEIGDVADPDAVYQFINDTYIVDDHGCDGQIFEITVQGDDNGEITGEVLCIESGLPFPTDLQNRFIVQSVPNGHHVSAPTTATGYVVPTIQWDSSHEQLVQPNYFITEPNQAPYITFTAEDFDYDAITLFHEDIVTWASQNDLNQKVGAYNTDDYCLAKSGDGNYYRARVIHHEPPIVKYMFIDFGSIETGAVDELREIPNYDDFRTRPASTVCCQINGGDELHEQGELSKKLTDLTTTSFNDSTNEIEVYWKVKVAYFDDAQQPVCNIFIKRSSDDDFVPLMDALRDTSACGDVTYSTEESPMKTGARASYEIGGFTDATEFPVTETYYDNENAHFWVQSATRDVMTFNDNLQVLVNELQVPEGPFTQGDPLVGLYTEDAGNCWYRCIISEVAEESLSVRYIDFGNTEIIPKSDISTRLRLPNDYLLSETAFAWPLELEDLTIDDISNLEKMNDVEPLDSYLNTLYEEGCKWTFKPKTSQKSNWRSCDVDICGILYCIRNGEKESFAKLISNKNEAFERQQTVSSSHQSPDEEIPENMSEKHYIRSSNSSLADTPEKFLGLPERRFEVKKIESNKLHHVVPFERDEDDLLWVQLWTDMEDCGVFMVELAELGASTPPVRSSEINSTSVFLALYDDEWHRAVLQKNDESSEKVHVCYIDYGTKGEAKKDQIHQIPDNYVDKSMYAFPVKLPPSLTAANRDELDGLIEVACDTDNQTLQFYFDLKSTEQHKRYLFDICEAEIYIQPLVNNPDNQKFTLEMYLNRNSEISMVSSIEPSEHGSPISSTKMQEACSTERNNDINDIPIISQDDSSILNLSQPKVVDWINVKIPQQVFEEGKKYPGWISHMDEGRTLHFTRAEDEQKLADMAEELQKVELIQFDEKLEKGTFLMANYEHGWYRAMIDCANNGDLVAYFVDFGNSVYVKQLRPEDMCYLDEQYCVEPQLCTKCCSPELQHFSEDRMDKIRQWAGTCDKPGVTESDKEYPNLALVATDSSTNPITANLRVMNGEKIISLQKLFDGDLSEKLQMSMAEITQIAVIVEPIDSVVFWAMGSSLSKTNELIIHGFMYCDEDVLIDLSELLKQKCSNCNISYGLDDRIGNEFKSIAGEHCVVSIRMFDEDCFVRAEVISDLGGAIEAHLVDYGITRTVSHEKCFPLVELDSDRFGHKFEVSLILTRHPYSVQETETKICDEFNKICGDDGFPAHFAILAETDGLYHRATPLANDIQPKFNDFLKLYMLPQGQRESSVVDSDISAKTDVSPVSEIAYNTGYGEPVNERRLPKSDTMIIEKSVNSSCLTEISYNISTHRVANENIPCQSTFQVGQKHRVILTNVRSKSLKTKAGSTEDLFIIHVCPMDKWEDINGLVEEAMRNPVPVWELPPIGSECIVKDNSFTAVPDKGYRRGVVEDPKNRPGHAVVREIDTGKTIAVKSSRIFKMPAALESFEKDLVKKVLINSVDGLENGQCMILDVTEKRDDAYVCSSVSVNEEKTRALDLVEELRRAIESDKLNDAKSTYEKLQLFINIH